MKIELHCHTDGSPCAKCPPHIVMESYKENGYDAVVVTNHYTHWIYDAYGFKSEKEYAEYFVKLIDDAITAGEKVGIKVFYGMEIRLKQTLTEYMLFGISKDLILQNPTLYDLTQEELFSFCQNNGVFMYQTHPFREGVSVGDARFMHGAEAFNGHFHHVNNNKLADEFCEKYNLIKLEGTDFHDEGQPITTGIIVDEQVNDIFELVKVIRSGKFKRIENKQLYKTQLIEYKKSTGRVLTENDLKYD